jgi:hypothetical protein
MSEIVYGDYLCHFNKNHSPKNGQFVSGDGDGDGQVNDRATKFGKVTNEASARAHIKTGKKLMNSSWALTGASLAVALWSTLDPRLSAKAKLAAHAMVAGFALTDLTMYGVGSTQYERGKEYLRNNGIKT